MKGLSLDPKQIRHLEKRLGVDATDLLQRYRKRDPGVVGVAYGRKVRGGKETNEACITFFVVKKLPDEQLDERVRLPAHLDEFEGAPTDVIEVGGFSPRSEKYRPAPGGCSISGVHVDPVSGVENKESGTLACRAFRESLLGSRRRWYALSNAHVMAQMDFSGAVGDVISQPSYADSALWETNHIATLSQWIPISDAPTAVNYVDAAIAAIDNLNVWKLGLGSSDTQPLVSDMILELGRLTEWRHWYHVSPGLEVAKRGAGLDLRKDGEVSHILGSFYVSFDGGPCLFEYQIVAKMLTVGGDSGSLMVTTEVGKHSQPAALQPALPARVRKQRNVGAVGLVFASSNQDGEKYTLANYIEAVQQLLNVKVADTVYEP